MDTNKKMQKSWIKNISIIRIISIHSYISILYKNMKKITTDNLAVMIKQGVAYRFELVALQKRVEILEKKLQIEGSW